MLDYIYISYHISLQGHNSVTIPPESHRLTFIFHRYENDPVENFDHFALIETEFQQIVWMCFSQAQLVPCHTKFPHTVFYSSQAVGCNSNSLSFIIYLIDYPVPYLCSTRWHYLLRLAVALLIQRYIET